MKKKDYTDEFKLEVVNEYLDGDLGCRLIARKYNLPSKNYIFRWKDELIKKGLLKDREKKIIKTSTHNEVLNKKTVYEKRLEQEILELRAKLAFYNELEKLGVDVHKKK